MSSIDSLTAAIRVALDQARHLFAGIGASREGAAEVRDRLAALGVEGKSAQIASVTDRLEEGQVKAGTLAARLEAALAAAEAARGQSSRGGAPPRPPPTPGPSLEAEHPWSGNPPVPNFRADRPNATCIEETRVVGWPVNHNGRVAARGRLYDAAGRPITGTVQAGSGPAGRASDLKEPWASDERMTTRWHIEGHAAAVMRANQLNEAVLYINIPPCGVGDRDQWRCHENLPHTLPSGSTLRVWVSRQDGGVEQFKYEGTGKALK